MYNKFQLSNIQPFKLCLKVHECRELIINSYGNSIQEQLLTACLVSSGYES